MYLFNVEAAYEELNAELKKDITKLMNDADSFFAPLLATLFQVQTTFYGHLYNRKSANLANIEYVMENGVLISANAFCMFLNLLHLSRQETYQACPNSIWLPLILLGMIIQTIHIILLLPNINSTAHTRKLLLLPTQRQQLLLLYHKVS